jgi:hypothetical protein
LQLFILGEKIGNNGVKEIKAVARFTGGTPTELIYLLYCIDYNIL